MSGEIERLREWVSSGGFNPYEHGAENETIRDVAALIRGAEGMYKALDSVLASHPRSICLVVRCEHEAAEAALETGKKLGLSNVLSESDTKAEG